MIFCLGDDILKELAGTKEVLDYDNYLSKQFIGLIESDNNCLLAESSQILKLVGTVISNKNVSDEMKKVVAYCAKNYTTMFGLTKRVNKQVILSKELKEDKNIYVTPSYLKNNKLQLNNKISLLSEDLSDCCFYEEITKKIGKFNGFDINFRHVAGAGRNIAKELDTAITHNNDFVYAICDSDMSYPNDEIGDTARYLNEEVIRLKGLGFIHLDHEVLKVCEKENLIKPTEYAKFYHKQELKAYIKIEQDQDLYHYLRYLDFKIGLEKRVYQKSEKYYETLLLRHDDCIKEVEGLEKKGNILKGLGRTCMNEFSVNHLEEGTTSLDEYRQKIVNNVVTWGISMKEQQIV